MTLEYAVIVRKIFGATCQNAFLEKKVQNPHQLKSIVCSGLMVSPVNPPPQVSSEKKHTQNTNNIQIYCFR